MACGAGVFVAEGRVHEGLHQLRLRGLVWIVAAQAIGFVERLVVVRLLKTLVLGIVTVEAKLRSRLRQVEVELSLPFFTVLVRDVASAATHVQRRVAASVFRNIHAHAVAGQAEVVLFRAARGRHQQLLFVR